MVSDYSFSVYNRYGNLMFTTNDPNRGKDGIFNTRKAETGLYMYNVRYRAMNGVARHSYNGNFTLIR